MLKKTPWNETQNQTNPPPPQQQNNLVSFCSLGYTPSLWGFQMLKQDDSTTLETQMNSKHFNTSIILQNLKKGPET